MTKAMAAGAAMLGAAGLIWASYPPELVWCGSLGLGSLALASGLALGGRRGAWVATAGALLANVGGTHYMAQAFSAGRPFGAWSIVGMGLALAAVGCLAMLARPRGWNAWALPLAFGIVLLGLVKDTARLGLTLDVWGAASALALAGAALLAFRSGRAYEAALGPARPPA